MEDIKGTTRLPSRWSSRWCHRDDDLKPGKGRGDKVRLNKVLGSCFRVSGGSWLPSPDCL